MSRLTGTFITLFLCFLIITVLGQNNELKNDIEPEQKVNAFAADGRVLIAQEYKVKEIDPARAIETGSARVISNVFEGLVRFKPGTVQVEPCLAQSWEVSDDGLTWTFHLRENVLFHNGTPFDAEAVKLNVERQLKKDEGKVTSYADFVFAPLDKVEAVDNHTVKFHLKYSYAPFLNNLAMPMAAPVISPASITHTSKGSKGVELAGTGPFILAEWYNEGVLLKANNDYWMAPPPMQEMMFITISGEKERVELLLDGQVDIALDLSFEHTSRLRVEGYPVFRITGLDICYLGFYIDRKPFSSASARKAVRLAINREKVFGELWVNEIRPAIGILPPIIPGYSNGSTAGDYDPEKAVKLLRDAGYSKGLAFTLITYDDPRPYSPGGGAALAGEIARSMSGAGITVEVKSYPWDEFKQALERREGDAFLYGWISDNGDPDNFLYTLLSEKQIQGGLNLTHYTNQQLETLLISARNTTDPEIRQELYDGALEIINRDVPLVVLGHSLHYAASSPAMQRLILSPTGWHSFYQVYSIANRG